jgi:ribulose-5-phosphate 4-epimerase/fuculose-1-phosphate aldolase
MEFAFWGTVPEPLESFAEGMRGALIERGYEQIDEPGAARLVLNFVTRDDVRPFRRISKSTFVATFWPADSIPDNVVAESYPVLVRALSNLSVCVVPGKEARFLTLEQGNYPVPFEGDWAAFYRNVAERLAPLAESNLVVDNIFTPDLEPELWGGDEATESIRLAGEKLEALQLLPAGFPIEDYLDERDLRHVKRLYSIGGLSYGNVSARKDENRFWMSGSGVDKSKLVDIGRDVSLVTDYDDELHAMKVSVPPGVEPKRVSVDAVEHWKIYQEHPQVGAILHVHAWVEGIVATEINYPCGTAELATAVADLVRDADDPGHAIIGLKNHGLTITGPDLGEIFDRIESRIQRRIPMS